MSEQIHKFASPILLWFHLLSLIFNLFVIIVFVWVMGEHSTHGQISGQLAGISFLSLLHVGSEDLTRTQVIKLRGKFLYLPSDLSGPIWRFYKVAKARTRK